MKLLEKDKQILLHILRYCDKIQNTVERFGDRFETFLNDCDYRDSVSMNLLQIGELAGRFSDAFILETRPQIDWRAIRNMRNMFAHDYGSMDYDRIWETVTEDIPILTAFCKDALM